MAFDLLARLKLKDDASGPLKTATKSVEKMNDTLGKMKPAAAGATQSSERLTNALGRNVKGLNDAQVAAGLWLDKTGRLRNATGKWATEQDKLAAGMKATTDATGKQGSTAAASSGGIMAATRAVVALAAAYVTLQGAMSTINATVGGAMRLEQEKIAMNHFIGLTNKANANKMTEEYIGWLRKNANETPFGTNEVIAAGRRAINVTAGNVEKGKELLKIAEDMAALNPGKSVMDAMEALADMKVGETERMKEFGFKISADELEAAGGGDVEKGAMKMMTTDVAKQFKGGAEKLSKSGFGLMSTVTGNIESAFTDMGVRSLELLKPVLAQLAALSGGKAMETFIERGSNALAAFFGFLIKVFTWVLQHQDELTLPFRILKKVIDFVVKAIEPFLVAFKDIHDALTGVYDIAKKKYGKDVKNAFNAVSKAASAVAEVFEKSWPVIGPLIAGAAFGVLTFKIYTLAAAAAVAIATGATSAWGIAMAFLNANWIAMAIGALIGGAVLIYKNWDKIVLVYNRVKDKMIELKEDGIDKVTEAIEKAKEKWDEFKTAAIDKVTQAIEDLTAWYYKHEKAIKRTATVLAVIFGPALIRTGITLLWLATVAIAKAIWSLTLLAARLVYTAFIMTTKFIIALIKSAVRVAALAVVITAKMIVALVKMTAKLIYTAVIMTTKFIIAFVRTAIQVAITAAVITGQMIVALVRYAASGWRVVAVIAAQTLAFVIQRTVMIAGAIATGILTAAQWALNAAFWANPIVWVIALIIALIVVVILIIKNWDTIKKKTLEVWAAMKEAIGKAITTVVGWVSEKWSKLKDSIAKPFEAAKDIISGIFEKIKGWFTSLLEWSTKLLDKIGLVKKEKDSGALSDVEGSDGSHRFGRAHIPYDGYRAELHEGERVLTKKENKEYTNGSAGGRTVSVQFGNVIIQGASGNVEDMADQLMAVMSRRLKEAGEIM